MIIYPDCSLSEYIISTLGGTGISEAVKANEELFEEILTKICALCKGFLLVAEKSTEKAYSFCRGLLILLQKLFDLMPETAND
jgi:hypothetical protein